MSKVHFRWVCGYRGCTDYMITDDTGTYRAEFRHTLEEYQPGVHNYTPAEWERDVVPTLGLLRRYIPTSPVPAATVAAFNEWRLAERADHVAKMKAAPEKYGEIDEHDTRLFPPILPARTGVYVVGKGWEIQ